MATALENLKTAREQISANIAAATLLPKPDYGVDGQSVSWSAYLAAQYAALDDLDKLIAKREPWRFVSVVI